MTDRDDLARDFVVRTGWGAAESRPLAGDASARSYRRLVAADGSTAVLMDAPPGLVEPIADFTRVARHLQSLGLSAPAILAEDPVHGFLLLEDLGDDLFARLLDTRPALEPDLYRAATDVLVRLQSVPPLPNLPEYGVPMMADYVSVLAEDYARTDPAPLVGHVRSALERLVPETGTMILRDYHAENLLWLPGRRGLARVGLLDFQMAMRCHPAYDLVSLLQDARRDVSPAVETAMVAHFAAATGADGQAFAAAYAALGAQRNLRIVGLFARLARTAGKTRYLGMIPRVWGLSRRCLAHPELADLAAFVTKTIPEPTPGHLQGLAAACPTP
ncbi:aminoglycoside phosphotransferase family protein [Acidimangrovimonas sediminis]|uniref:aminoglycoside phosphotransferase family protein n=1 Tax=Acidimangrovimonas sediminis TaxID=2056283 RepID=UPI000C801869|nr:phosphotransferase [Acidimangrovimonas sediminis]